MRKRVFIDDKNDADNYDDYNGCVEDGNDDYSDSDNNLRHQSW